MNGQELLDGISHLCAYCQTVALAAQELSASEAEGEKIVPHHKSFQRLSDSAETCAFCSCLRGEVVKNAVTPSEVAKVAGRPQYEIQLRACRSLVVNTYNIEISLIENGLLIQNANMSWLSIYDVGVFQPHQEAERVSVIMERIKRWLINCMEHHNCWSVSYAFPRRLLDVGSAIDSIPPRVVDTTSIDEKKSLYATLSHCWGPNPVHTLPKLTRATEAEYREKIPLTSLPKSFRDAVEVCRSLGLQYIWIDCLCILQDSTIDWQEESAKMAQIYAGSRLSLAATSASDSNGGLWPLPKSNALSSWPAIETHRSGRFSSPWNNEKRNMVATITRRQERQDIVGHELFDSPLAQRGWVLQESILAPCKVHFAHNRLYWECNHLFQDEHREISRAFISRGEPRPNFRVTDPFDNRLNWWGIVRNLTARKFTVSTDRTAAMVGLLSLHQRRTGHDHVLGFWLTDTFVLDLDWRVAAEGRCPEAEHESSKMRQTMPTWTWLSIHGQIAEPRSMSRPDPKGWSNLLLVESCRVEWSGVPLVSTLKHCEMVVTGYMAPIRGTSDNMTIQPPAEAPRLLDGDVANIAEIRFKDTDHGTLTDFWPDLPMRVADLDSIQLLLVATDDRQRSSERCLAVTPLRGLGMNDAYVRVGAAALFNPKPNNFQPLVQRAERRTISLF